VDSKRKSLNALVSLCPLNKWENKMQEKNYINGITLKEKTFDDGGSLINVGIKVDDFIEQLNAIKKNSGWANIVIAKNREATEKGLTHHMYESTFEPKDEKLF
tara:strand:- start:912 stop:1220 length:309 start_codon:yes stop_codon:yes gene_type:complete